MADPLALDETTIADSIDDYLAECRARGLRPATVDGSYAWALRSLWLPWCEARGLRSVGEITQRIANDFTVDLRQRQRADGRPISPHSVRSFGIAITRWLRWARDEGQLRAPARIPGTRTGKAIREIITEDEYRALQATARNDRDRLIFQILWETGMRASELLCLRCDDLVRLDGRWFLRVLMPSRGGGAKGSRERLAPFPNSRDLRRYLSGPRSRLEAGCDNVFVTLTRGRAGTYAPLTLSGLEQLVRRAAVEAGIKHRVHPHLFRHSAITRWRRAKMDPLWIIAVVGHTSLAMLERTYDQTDHRDAYDALAAVLERP